MCGIEDDWVRGWCVINYDKVLHFIQIELNYGMGNLKFQLHKSTLKESYNI